jgi:FkbM family methyltransferase
MMIRTIAKKLLPSPVWHALKDFWGIHLDGYSLKSFSQEGEDLLLRRLFLNRRAGFYVDVGAHHPVRYSNTYSLYRLGWRGINIEPNLSGIRLFERYRPDDVNLALGVSDEPGKLTYWMFDEPALNSLDKELTERRLAETTYKLIGTKTIPVLRLDSILEMHVPPNVQIDFMTIDTEGHDLAVLQSNNWDRFRPKWLLVEQIVQEPLDDMRSDQHEFLLAHHYRLYAKTLNTLFYLDTKGGRCE